MSKYIKTTFMSLTLLLSSKIVAQDPQHKDQDQAPGNQNLLSQEDLNLIEQNQDRFHAYLSADLVDCLSQIKESKDMPKEVSNLKNYAKDHRIVDCDFISNAINQAIDYCKSSPENYKHIESLEEYKNCLEDGSAIITLDSVTRGHKCKKSKCFCRLRVSKEIRAGSLFTSGNASVSGAFTAGSVTTSGALSAGSISTTGALSAGSVSTSALTTSTINGANPVLDEFEPVYVLRGAAVPPTGLSIQVTFTPSTGSRSPYPYTLSSTFTLNGTSGLSSVPMGVVGSGFTIGNLTPFTPAGLDLAYYMAYPQEVNFDGVPHNIDSFWFYFAIPVTFNAPFTSAPIVNVTTPLSPTGLFGATGYNNTEEGAVIVQYAHVMPLNVTSTGFTLFTMVKFLVTESGYHPVHGIPTIEKNVGNILTSMIMPFYFTVYGS